MAQTLVEIYGAIISILIMTLIGLIGWMGNKCFVKIDELSKMTTRSQVHIETLFHITDDQRQEIIEIRQNNNIRARR